jgi:ubiquinone/menaquinone biosynthesis C-methylase UbiE
MSADGSATTRGGHAIPTSTEDTTAHRASRHSPQSFNDSYADSTPPPWDIGRPQPAFERLANAGGLAGRVLDVGCGTGEHAILAASLGHETLGMDIAPRAIDRATKKAATWGLDVDFVVFDALRLPELGTQFQTVLDCGLFHCFEDRDRLRFVDGLAHVVQLGGRYHMLCFSDRQPGDWGPRRVTENEIRTSFATGWSVDSIEPTILDITIDPAGAQAWHTAVTRRSTVNS